MTQKASAKKKRGKLAFLGDVFSELKKVSWPSRQQTIRLTIIVIVVSAVIGVILWGVDQGFYRLVRMFF